MWGAEKTLPDDMPWYLPKSLVGDALYRNQGVLFHGALAASPVGTAARVANALYAVGTVAAGRTSKNYGSEVPELSGASDRPYWQEPSAMVGVGGKSRRNGIFEGEIAKTPWTYPDSDQNMAYSFLGREKNYVDGKWKRWK